MLNPMKFFFEYIPAIVTLTQPAIVTLNHPAIVTLNHPAAIVTPNSNSNSFHLEQYIKKYIHTLKHSEQAQRQIKTIELRLQPILYHHSAIVTLNHLAIVTLNHPAIVTLNHLAIVTLNHPAIVTLNHPAIVTLNQVCSSQAAPSVQAPGRNPVKSSLESSIVG